jgi:hypothetical protein
MFLRTLGWFGVTVESIRGYLWFVWFVSAKLCGPDPVGALYPAAAVLLLMHQCNIRACGPVQLLILQTQGDTAGRQAHTVLAGTHVVQP